MAAELAGFERAPRSRRLMFARTSTKSGFKTALLHPELLGTGPGQCPAAASPLHVTNSPVPVPR